jgi:iron complex transport system substrate-binding protein
MHLHPLRPAAAAALACTAAVAALAVIAAQAPPQRIVSLVPAVTEMLFAIGAGPRVVGVSSFDRYPPEVATRTRVGALVDPDVERILALRPDLVVVYATQDELRAQLARAAIPTVVYRHGGLADIGRTMRELGTRAGVSEQARAAATAFEATVARVRSAVSGRPRPRTLLVFGRDPSSLRNIYAAGGTGFLHDALLAAGGRNVFEEIPRESVQVSTEMILARAPEVIIELRATALGEGGDVSAWQRLASVPAVKAGRIHVLSGDRFVSPGPRFAVAIAELAKTLHPGAHAER